MTISLITENDLRLYRAVRREPIVGTYRDFQIVSMPPPSSGGVAIVQALNIVEQENVPGMAPGSADFIHLTAEALRAAFRDRARHLGDPDANPDMPLARLLSKDYARNLWKSFNMARASRSTIADVAPSAEGSDTTHLSVLDKESNAVALTYTLEESYGSMIVVEGAGFLLNNEMGDFNAAPGLTLTNGLIGTAPNLAAPGKRMLSSMSPTIVVRNGKPFLVTGSPGGRTIISTVLLSILRAIDYGMDAREIVDAPRFHHQWLPNVLQHEPLPPDVLGELRTRGHSLREVQSQGAAQVILFEERAGKYVGAADTNRAPDSYAASAMTIISPARK